MGFVVTCFTIGVIIAIVEWKQNKVKRVNLVIWDSYKKGIDADCSRFMMDGRA